MRYLSPYVLNQLIPMTRYRALHAPMQTPHHELGRQEPARFVVLLPQLSISHQYSTGKIQPSLQPYLRPSVPLFIYLSRRLSGSRLSL